MFVNAYILSLSKEDLEISYYILYFDTLRDFLKPNFLDSRIRYFVRFDGFFNFLGFSVPFHENCIFPS